ncbi:MAG: T9SS type A sorting domain-containing protein [Saprospiraceae bacterium]
MLISKHILNIELLTSPYSIIAADGNNSGTITTFDIVEIRKLILGIYNELPSNYSWRFIPKTYTFQNPSDPFSEAFPQEIRMATLDQDIANADFWSVKIGDVNGMYGPSAQAVGTDRDEKPEHAWPIKVQTQNTDGKFMVDFQTSQAGMSGLQFTLLFDASSLEFEQLIPLNPAIGMQHFNMQQMAYGKLPVCIDLPEGVNGTDLFRLVFKSKSNTGAEPDFKLISAPTPALAYDTWGQVYLPVLQAGPATAALAYPNPFSTSGVTIDLLEWENGEFQLFDVYGQLIYETTIEKSHVLHLPSSLFKQAGSYLFSISNGRERTQGQLEYTGTKN